MNEAPVELKNKIEETIQKLNRFYKFTFMGYFEEKAYLVEPKNKALICIQYTKNKNFKFSVKSPNKIIASELRRKLKKILTTDDNLNSQLELDFGEANEKKSLAIPAFYVDGAYINDKTRYSLILVIDGKKQYEESGEVPKGFRESRQVGGELYAALRAVQKAIELKYEKIILAYDYEGIKKWATGEWKTKIELTKNYARLMNSYNIEIKWKKIASHSGDYFNNIADRLARGNN